MGNRLHSCTSPLASKESIFPNWAVSVSGETGKPQKDKRGKEKRKRGTSEID
ncbi:hypothetical protein ACNR90_005027 [Candidozyma auris]